MTRNTISWPMTAMKIQNICFFVALDGAGTRVCGKDGAISRQGKDSVSRYQSLSCSNMRAIRTRDCTLVARVRNREQYHRRGRNGDRHKDAGNGE